MLWGASGVWREQGCESLIPQSPPPFRFVFHTPPQTFSLDRLLARGIHTLQIIVAEAPQQEGSYTRRLTAGPLTVCRVASHRAALRCGRFASVWRIQRVHVS